MRALVTGACGFVGRHLVRHLVASGDEVLGTVFKAHEDLPAPTIQVDLTDPQACAQIINNYSPDVIYHLAGMAFVPQADESFEEALKTNVGVTHNLVHPCHLSARGTTVVLASSAEVCGKITSDQLPLTEATPEAPANSYALTKLMAEMVLRRYQLAGTVRTVILRLLNHIGPGQNERFVASNFARQLAQIKQGAIPACLHVGNLAVRRDFSDVRDVVRGYRLAAKKGQGTYVLCSGRSIAIRELLDQLVEISGMAIEIKTDQTKVRSGEIQELYGSYRLAERELGWKPEIPLRQTLRDIYTYWQTKL